MNFFQTTIEHLGRIITGKTPKTKEKTFWDGDIPFVTPQDLQHGKHILSTERKITSEGANSVKGAILPPKAICVSCIGNLGYVSQTCEKSVTNQQINSIIVNEQNDADFIYYLLKSMWPFFKNLEGQSTTLSILNKTLFSKIEVTIPSLEEQQRISYILNTLDEKIEQNAKINQNLEQQAQVLFERLLCSGNGETTLDSIALINPSRSMKKGCLARCIDMAQLSTSQSFPQLGTIKPYSGGMKFKNGDTIFARITPCLENGKTAYIDFLKEDEVAFGSTEYIVMSSRGGMPSPFFYCLARYKDFIEYATKRMNGSSGRQRVSADAIAAFPIPFFSGDAMCEFGKTALPVFNVIKNNSIENLRLATLRDTLLPRLMSGEIDVSEVAV